MSTAVSVVMAVHNGRRFLPEQLASVLAQLEPGDELVAIDDASSDGSADLLLSSGDPRVRVERNQRNLGVLATFERGLRLARHDVIFLCDQDDVWLPGKRQAMLDVLENDPPCLLVVSDAQVIDATGQVRLDSFMATRGGFHGGILSTVLRNRYLGCAMAFRRPLLTRALPFPSDIPLHDMWLGAIATLTGRTRYLSTPLIQYRRHDANASPATRRPMVQMLRWRWCLIRALAMRLL